MLNMTCDGFNQINEETIELLQPYFELKNLENNENLLTDEIWKRRLNYAIDIIHWVGCFYFYHTKQPLDLIKDLSIDIP